MLHHNSAIYLIHVVLFTCSNMLYFVTNCRTWASPFTFQNHV